MGDIACLPLCRVGLGALHLVTAYRLRVCVEACQQAYNRVRTLEESAPPAATEKDCPHCLMRIPIGAMRCGHCTSELPASSADPAPA